MAFVLVGCRPSEASQSPETKSSGGQASAENELDGASLEPQPEYAEAEQLIHAGRIDEALANIESLIAKNPKQAVFHVVRGNALTYLDRDDEALAAFEQALAINPMEGRAHVAIARIQAFSRRQTDAAVEHLEQAIAIDEQDAEAHRTLGIIRLDQGQIDDAIRLLESARSIDPRSADTLFNLAQALARKGKLTEAVATAKTSVELDPGSSGIDLRLQYAKLLAASGASDKSVEQLRKSEKLAGGSSMVLFEVVRGYLELGKSESALVISKQLVKSTAQEPAIWVVHGRVLAALEQLDGTGGALAAWDQALQLSPSLPAGHVYKIEALAKAGRCKAARAALKQYKKHKQQDSSPSDWQRAQKAVKSC